MSATARPASTRWNKILERHGMSDRLRLPDRKFNRGIGQFAGRHFDPTGRAVSDEDEWTRRRHEVAAGPADKAFLLSIMNSPDLRSRADSPTTLRRRARGVKGKPVNFEYDHGRA